jgi:hypothetical protein
MRPWYVPFSKGDEGGPRRVKCHSKRFVSIGEAWKSRDGLVASSEASFTIWHVSRSCGKRSTANLRMRLMVGFLVLKEPTVVMIARGM